MTSDVWHHSRNLREWLSYWRWFSTLYTEIIYVCECLSHEVQCWIQMTLLHTVFNSSFLNWWSSTHVCGDFCTTAQGFCSPCRWTTQERWHHVSQNLKNFQWFSQRFANRTFFCIRQSYFRSVYLRVERIPRTRVQEIMWATTYQRGIVILLLSSQFCRPRTQTRTDLLTMHKQPLPVWNFHPSISNRTFSNCRYHRYQTSVVTMMISLKRNNRFLNVGPWFWSHVPW